MTTQNDQQEPLKAKEVAPNLYVVYGAYKKLSEQYDFFTPSPIFERKEEGSDLTQTINHE